MEAGRLLADRYQLEALIGEGGMGEVWRARHVGLGERVAVKILRLAPDDDEAVARNRFDLEAKLCARLARRTNHVVSVIDQGEADGGVPFLVMELLSGETLEDILASGGVLTFPKLEIVLTHVARALDCAHAQGIIHRDLKPSNVFLTKDDDGKLLVKVLDFGIARIVERLDGADVIQAVRNTKEGSVLGTPLYMSPEQATGAKELGPDCDTWAFAVMTYEALAGTVPFNGSTVGEVIEAMQRGEAPLSTLRPELPRALDAVFTRAFSLEKRRRYRSASSFAAAVLHTFQTATRRRELDTTCAVPVSVFATRRWAIGGIAGALAIALALVISATRSDAPSPKPAPPTPTITPITLAPVVTQPAIDPIPTAPPEPTVPAKKTSTKPARSEDKSAVF